MKANELMIGDFVTFKDCQNDKKPVIIKIWSINQDGEAFAFIDNDESVDEIVIDDEIVGIPLTPEILEKNGFVKQEACCFRYFKSYDENYYIGFESIYYLFERKTAKITKEHSQSGLQEKVEFTCEYLHELQHALKLCGIEKTIEL